MLDQNTDRMWYVIGAVLIGAAIIFGMNTLMPEAFASVGGSFNDVIDVISNNVKNIAEEDNPNNLLNLNSIRNHSAATHKIKSNINLGQYYEVTSSWDASGIHFGPKENLIIGETYKVSVKVRSTSDNTDLYIALNDIVLAEAEEYMISDEWVEITTTFVNTGYNTRLRFYSRNREIFYVLDPTLELLGKE